MGLFGLFSKEREKETIESFFKIDINNISLSDFEKKTDKEYIKTLPDIELGMFDKLRIIPNENTYTLEFVSCENYISKEFAKFINFIAKNYGNDMLGNGEITNQEFGIIQSQLSFMRMWNLENIAIMISNIQEDETFFTLMIKGIKINN